MNPDATNPLDPTASPSDSGSVDAVIAAVLAAEDAGQPLDRAAVIEAHPVLADALRAFFRDHDQFGQMAAPLRDAAADLTATNYETGTGAEPLPATVRYFGDYEILATIGQGGMGIVSRARQQSLNRLVALKMLRAGVLASDDDLRRFQNEAEAVALLDHPRIVPIFEVGRHDDRPYFAMKLIEGTSLDKVLAAFGTDFRATARLVLDIAEAVHHAHQRGILHRDLKPANILLDEAGQAYVTDFGLAKRTANVADLTLSGAILGTPAYMAPEQAAGRHGLVTTATDVYGLGAILYALLTGHAPFRGESLTETLHLVATAPPVSPTRNNPQVPRDLATIALKCLDKDPHRRYPSALALAADLRRWLAGEPIHARPTGPLERLALWTRRNKAVAALLLGIGASLVAGLTASTYFGLRESRRAQSEHYYRTQAELAQKTTLAERDATERTLAQALVGPLDPEGEGKVILSQPEAESLWKLATADSDRLGLRFLDEATRDPLTTRQIRARAEPAMIAAVGLDPQRRTAARALLASRLGDPALSLTHKTDIALIALELEDEPDSTTDIALQMIRQGYNTRSFEDYETLSLNRHIDSAYVRMNHTIMPRVERIRFNKAMNALQANNTTNIHFDQNFTAIMNYLKLYATQLADDQATQVRFQVVDAILPKFVMSLKNTTPSSTRLTTLPLLEELIAVADAMRAGDSEIVCQKVFVALEFAGLNNEFLMHMDVTGNSEILVNILSRTEKKKSVGLYRDIVQRNLPFRLETVVSLARGASRVYEDLPSEQRLPAQDEIKQWLLHAMKRDLELHGSSVFFKDHTQAIVLLPPSEALQAVLHRYSMENSAKLRSSLIDTLIDYAETLNANESLRFLAKAKLRIQEDDLRTQLVWKSFKTARNLNSSESERILEETTSDLASKLEEQTDRKSTTLAESLLIRSLRLDQFNKNQLRSRVLDSFRSSPSQIASADFDKVIKQLDEKESTSLLNPIVHEWETELDQASDPQDQQRLIDRLGKVVV